MCGKEKKVCIWTSLYTLVLLFLHYSFCIWGLKVYNCTYKVVKKKEFFYFLYMTYFLSSSCHEPDLKAEILPACLADNQKFFNYTDIDSIKFPEKAYARERTHEILKNYIIINTLLLATTALLLVGALINLKGYLSLILYMPWPFAMLITCIYDVVTTAWYAVDVGSTFGFLRWFRFIGGTPIKIVYLLDLIFPTSTISSSSIFMMVMCAKLYIFWFINVCLCMRIFQIALNAYNRCDPDVFSVRVL